MAEQDSTTSALVIAEIPILQDAHGFYNLNGLHRASKAKEHKKPSNWLDLLGTQELIAELQVIRQECTLRVVKGGNASGVWVTRLLAEEYKRWLEMPRRNKNNLNEFIYVIQSDDERHPFKIGMTIYPDRRLETLKNFSPVPLTFRYLWQVKDAATIEKTLHLLFAAVNTHGEWFALSEKDEAILVRQMKKYRLISSSCTTDRETLVA